MGDTNSLTASCNDVLVAFDSLDDIPTQDKKLQEIIDIKILEKQIN